VEHDWEKYIEIARRFEHKANYQDREDLRHSIILALAQQVERYRHNGDKPLTEFGMLRIASHTVADYYRDLRLPTGYRPCGRCPKTQRSKCAKYELYDQCRKGVEVVSLNSHIEDGEGNSIELIDTIADDNAIDLDAWLDAKVWLLGCPRRLIEIAHKIVNGEALNHGEICYLSRFREKSQLKLL
jgi:DNA-directed RNA polymerase specialized sigma24 family protein